MCGHAAWWDGLLQRGIAAPESGRADPARALPFLRAGECCSGARGAASPLSSTRRQQSQPLLQLDKRQQNESERYFLHVLDGERA